VGRADGEAIYEQDIKHSVKIIIKKGKNFDFHQVRGIEYTQPIKYPLFLVPPKKRRRKP
jgi:hypothetical protein